MNVKINGKNIDITTSMKDYLKGKLTYFDKFMEEDTPINVSVSKRNTHIKIEAYLQYNKKDVKAKVEEEDFYVAVDKMMDILKNSVSKLHRQIKDKNRHSIKAEHKKQLELEEEKLIENENEDEE